MTILRHRYLPLFTLAFWLSGLLLIYARCVEPNLLEVEIVPLPPTFTKDLTGVRIVHLADLHVSADGKREKRLVEAVNSLRPDLILITGDVAQFYAGTEAARAVVSRMRARYGTFMVLGDADYANRRDHCRYCHEADLRTIQASPPFRVLRNGYAVVHAEGREIIIAGVDDPSGPCAGRFPALPPAIPETTLRILLSPSPLVFPEAKERGYDLVLTGDTHGGQVRIPGIGPFYRALPSARYGFEGWVVEGATAMFINRGFGTSYLPFRFACPPAVVAFEETSRSTGQ